MSDCYINASSLGHRDDMAFMGRTHALSAVAVFLVLAAFLPAVTEWVAGSSNIWITLMAAIVVAGASLLPDLDNSSSTARNSLGPLGAILSGAVRSVSVVVQTTVRTSRDDAEANPHRGVTHTIPGALAFGLGAFALTTIPGSVTLPKLGAVSIGDMAAIIITSLLLHLALEALAKEFMEKLGDSLLLGEIIEFAVAFGVTIAIFTQLPEGTGFWWLGAGIFAGAVVHIIGDCFTTAGCPVLFPIPRKGKLWYRVRLTSMKAGGTVENYVFIPIFALAIVVASLRLLNVL